MPEEKVSALTFSLTFYGKEESFRVFGVLLPWELS